MILSNNKIAKHGQTIANYTQSHSVTTQSKHNTQQTTSFRAVCVADILYGRVDLIHGGYAVAAQQQHQQQQIVRETRSQMSATQCWTTERGRYATNIYETYVINDSIKTEPSSLYTKSTHTTHPSSRTGTHRIVSTFCIVLYMCYSLPTLHMSIWRQTSGLITYTHARTRLNSTSSASLPASEWRDTRTSYATHTRARARAHANILHYTWMNPSSSIKMKVTALIWFV